MKLDFSQKSGPPSRFQLVFGESEVVAEFVDLIRVKCQHLSGRNLILESPFSTTFYTDTAAVGVFA